MLQDLVELHRGVKLHLRRGTAYAWAAFFRVCVRLCFLRRRQLGLRIGLQLSRLLWLSSATLLIPRQLVVIVIKIGGIRGGVRVRRCARTTRVQRTHLRFKGRVRWAEPLCVHVVLLLRHLPAERLLRTPQQTRVFWRLGAFHHIRSAAATLMMGSLLLLLHSSDDRKRLAPFRPIAPRREDGRCRRRRRAAALCSCW